MLRLFLCGDVMTGRGIDQALPYPVNPVLYEPHVRDARDYVHLAEKAGHLSLLHNAILNILFVKAWPT